MSQDGIETCFLSEELYSGRLFSPTSRHYCRKCIELFVRKVETLRKLTNKTYKHFVLVNTDLRKMTWVTMRKSYYLRTFLFVRKFGEYGPWVIGIPPGFHHRLPRDYHTVQADTATRILTEWRINTTAGRWYACSARQPVAAWRDLSISTSCCLWILKFEFSFCREEPGRPSHNVVHFTVQVKL